MFHYDKDMSDHASEAYGIRNPDGIMYRNSKENPLIDEFGIYVLTRLPTFQNMKSLRVDVDTDIHDCVRHSTELLDGTRVYCFSKELLVFFVTMVMFSLYHEANNPNAAGPADAFYEAARAHYKKVSYDELHKYIEEGLVEWYARFMPDAAGQEDEEDAEPEAGGDDHALEETDSRSEAQGFSFSLKRKSLAAPAVAAAPSGPGAAGTAATATGTTAGAAAAQK